MRFILILITNLLLIFNVSAEENFKFYLEKAIKNNLPFYFVSAWITLEIDSTLDSIGLTSAFSKKLTKAGISCNVIAAYHHDHIFVPYLDKHKAMEILSDMYESQNN